MLLFSVICILAFTDSEYCVDACNRFGFIIVNFGRLYCCGKIQMQMKQMRVLMKVMLFNLTYFLLFITFVINLISDDV